MNNNTMITIRNSLWDYCKDHGVDSSHREAILDLIEKASSTQAPKVFAKIYNPSSGGDKVFLVEMGKGPTSSIITVIAQDGAEAVDKICRYNPYKGDIENKDPWTVLKSREIKFPGYTISVAPIEGVDVVSI